LHATQLLFTLPCGQGSHSAQSLFTLPWGQELHFAQLRFTLPWGQGVHSAQLLFCLSCEHRFRTMARLQFFAETLKRTSHVVPTARHGCPKPPSWL
jgi:hypothetical protein